MLSWYLKRFKAKHVKELQVSLTISTCLKYIDQYQYTQIPPAMVEISHMNTHREN